MRSDIARKSADHLMPQASPGWQTAFLVWSIVCIGWMTYSGWRAGIIRGVVSLAAMVFSYMIGSAVALTIPAGMTAWLPLPALLAKVIAGVGVGIAVFVGIWILGAALFKRTGQQRSMIFKLIWGTGGAICGWIFGLLLVLSILAGVRTLGAFSEARMEAGTNGSNPPKLAFWEPSLVKLKRSIDAGDTGTWVQQLDITPVSTARIIKKLGRILSDPRATQRFLESKHVIPVVSDRAFVNLIADPDINEAAINGDHLGILLNPKVLDAIRDPVLWEKMQSVQWEAAMDEALIQPAPTPAAE